MAQVGRSAHEGKQAQVGCGGVIDGDDGLAGGVEQSQAADGLAAEPAQGQVVELDAAGDGGVELAHEQARGRAGAQDGGQQRDQQSQQRDADHGDAQRPAEPAFPAGAAGVAATRGLAGGNGGIADGLPLLKRRDVFGLQRHGRIVRRLPGVD